MNRSFGGPDRGNKLVHERGLKGGSYGCAGRAFRLSDVDHDTRVTITAMLARGVSAERIAVQIGTPLTAVRLVARLNER